MRPSKRVVRFAAAQRSAKRTASSRAADERLQSVIDLAADFYWEQDARGRFTVYRPSGEPDAGLAELVGKTSFELFGAIEATDTHEPFSAMLERRAPFRDVLHRLGSEATGARYF